MRSSAGHAPGESAGPGTAPEATHVDSARTIFGTAVVNVIYVALGLIVASVLARTLGPDGRGAYAAILSVPMVLSIVANFGLPSAILLEGAQRPEQAGSAYLTAQLAMLLLFVPLAIAGWIALPSILASQEADTIESARWFLLASVPAIGAFELSNTALQGTRWFRAWNGLRLSQMLAWPLLLVGALALGHRSARAYSLLLAASYWLVVPAVLLFLAKRSPPPWKLSWDAARRMFAYGLSAWAATLPMQLNRRVDQIALAAVAPPAALGLYAVGVTVSSTIGHFVGPVANVVAPLVAAASQEEHRRLFRRFGRASVIAAVIAGIGVACASPLGIVILFGRSFAPAILPTLILVVAGSVDGVARVLGDALMVLGRPSRVLRAELAGLAAMAIGLRLSLPDFPLMGTALTCLASRLVILATTAEQIRSALGMPRREFLLPTASDCREFLDRARRLAGRFGARGPQRPA